MAQRDGRNELAVLASRARELAARRL